VVSRAIVSRSIVSRAIMSGAIGESTREKRCTRPTLYLPWQG
jgi:hypothetical protein